MCAQEVLGAYYSTSAYRQPVPRFFLLEAVTLAGRVRMRYIVAGLCEMFSVTPMADGENPITIANFNALHFDL
jgi:hypothetical protein